MAKGRACAVQWIVRSSNRKRWLGAIVVLSILSFDSNCFAAPQGSTKKLYRYKNEKGVVVIDDHVPPAFAKDGYEVLTRDGRVIETVPRQLTGEEGARARALEEEAKRLQEWDKNLLLRYSSVDDIAAARDRALREIDVRLSILRSNLLSIKSQIESEQSKAADLERRGVAVPAAVTTNVEKLRQEITDTEEAIAQRTEEKTQVAASFQKDIDRFQTLQDMVDFRRSNAEGK
jgi:chromosome segregation ATPase